MRAVRMAAGRCYSNRVNLRFTRVKLTRSHDIAPITMIACGLSGAIPRKLLGKKRRCIDRLRAHGTQFNDRVVY